MEQDQTGDVHDSKRDFATIMKSQTMGLVDTNVILSSLRNDCLHDRDSRLVRSTFLNCSLLFASDHVFEEIYERLPRLAYGPVSLQQLRSRFESNYLPIIRFVRVSDPDEPDAQVIKIPDIDDLPTGNLAQLISPVVVFSEDSDLIDADFAVSDWRNAAKWAAEFAETKMEHHAAMNLYALPIFGAWHGSKILGRRLKIHPLLPAIFISSLIAVGVQTFLRKQKHWESAKNAGQRLLTHYANEFQLQDARLHALRAATYVRSNPPTSLQKVATVLSRAQGPILVREIRARIISQFGLSGCPTLSEIREIVTRGTEFVSVRPHRWQFGAEMTPREETSEMLWQP